MKSADNIDRPTTFGFSIILPLFMKEMNSSFIKSLCEKHKSQHTKYNPMITTKKGDNGETDIKGERVKKHSPRIASIGAVDELNATIGIARNYVGRQSINDVLRQVQHDLFTIQADLAKQDKKTEPEMTEFLDKALEAIDETLPKQTKFILPAGNLAGTHLHLARTVCRRAERDCFKLNEYDPINPEILKYLNRLSDLLHIFARAENDNEEEVDYSNHKP